ncbi:MAG: hypothetical protein HQ503_08500 [Rhodospirillales bacterium]|nr:hypothetical protein [Rhodospirillales bacterium]
MTDNENGSIARASILNGFPDPVILLNGARKITAYNRAAGKLLSLGELGRDLALSLRHPDILIAADAVLGGNIPEPVEISLLLNVRRDFTLHASPLSGDEGAMLVLHEVTAARAADQMRADFVANVSHELRSPLSSLTGFIETLQGPAKDDADSQSKFLCIMEAEAGRMTRLINDLLSLSKVEAREYILPDGSVNLSDVLKTIADTLSVRAGERGIDIKFETAPGVSPVTGDLDEMTIVFQNLLDNAISYGTPHLPVLVSIKPVERIPETASPGIAVAINNQGDLIPSELLPRLTERFYRVDTGRSRAMGGTGLGLAIVKHIINRHRGRLIIESKAETGTTFTVYLPK